MPKIKPITVGCLVAFNNLPDAAWFEVTALGDRDSLTVKEYDPTGVTNYARQITFKSLVKQVRDNPTPARE